MSEIESGCVDDFVLHAWADDNDETMNDERRSEVGDHVATCDTCSQQVEELRRFRTLLLRARVPTLQDDQWRMLDTRIEMMAGEPPPRGGQTAGRIYWGIAIAAAVSIFAVGGWQLLQGRGAGPTTTLSEAGQARVAGAFTTVPVAVAEGSLEIAGADGLFRALRVDDKLARGAQVRSSAGGRLVVADNFELRIAAGTALSVLAGNEREVFLRLRHGAVACRVNKRRPGQRFGILAGRFRTSVVGTEFTVRHDQEGRVAVAVTEGAVRVDEADDPWRKVSETTSVVRAGNRWRFTGGRMDLGPIVQEPEPGQAERRAPHGDENGARPVVAGAPAKPQSEETPPSATALSDSAPSRPALDAGRDGAALEPAAARRVRRPRAGSPTDATHVDTALRGTTSPTDRVAPRAAASVAVPSAVLSLPPPLPAQPSPPAPLDRGPTRPTAGAVTAARTAPRGAKPAAGKSAGSAEATDPSIEHRILINVPPQAMTPEEIRRAKAAERRRGGHGRALHHDVSP